MSIILLSTHYAAGGEKSRALKPTRKNGKRRANFRRPLPGADSKNARGRRVHAALGKPALRKNKMLVMPQTFAQNRSEK